MSRAFEAERIDFGPDIQEGDITVSERFWVPDAMLGRGMITEAQYAAAKRYRDDYYAGRNNPNGVAQRAFQAGSRAIGEVLAPALAWCVLSNGTVTGWAECKGWEVSRAARQVVDGLERLAAHYERT